MDTQVKYYCNIFEVWTDDRDVGNYLYENKIRYDLRVVKGIDFEIDSNWMETRKDKHNTIYTAELTEHEILFIKLSFPNLHIYRPILQETIVAMSKQALHL